MRVLVVAPAEGDQGPAMLADNRSKTRFDIVTPSILLSGTKGTSADLVILSDKLQEPDRNLCLQWAIEFFSGLGKTKSYIKSHIVFV